MAQPNVEIASSASRPGRLIADPFGAIDAEVHVVHFRCAEYHGSSTGRGYMILLAERNTRVTSASLRSKGSMGVKNDPAAFEPLMTVVCLMLVLSVT